jgi:hypothetical protein
MGPSNDLPDKWTVASRSLATAGLTAEIAPKRAELRLSCSWQLRLSSFAIELDQTAADYVPAVINS